MKLSDLTTPQIKAAQHGLLVLRVEPQPKKVPPLRGDCTYTNRYYWPNQPDDYEGEDHLARGLVLSCPHKPGDRIPLCDLCGGTGKVKAYRGEPSQGSELVRCDLCGGKGGAFVVDRVEARQATDLSLATIGDLFPYGFTDGITGQSWFWTLTGRWEGSE
jgi:hypothetical protein